MIYYKNLPSIFYKTTKVPTRANTVTFFHLVDLSPWPFVVSCSLYVVASGAAMYFNGYLFGGQTLLFGFSILVASISLWLRDVCREGFQGQHTKAVTKGIILGFSLFIVSEIFLFIAFFWALFHSSLVPAVVLGNVWPPLGIEPINPWLLPFLNAIILLSSGATVTYSHHGILCKGMRPVLIGLYATIALALLFTCLMGLEYVLASYSISDSVYGSVFYMLTGLHGSHIIIALLFLAVGAYRVRAHHFSNLSFLGLELGILYYHFVDVVFLAVFAFVYWWNSGVEIIL